MCPPVLIDCVYFFSARLRTKTMQGDSDWDVAYLQRPEAHCGINLFAPVCLCREGQGPELGVFPQFVTVGKV